MFSESAVSPVIGVMLMIVVTVILAAAVSSFSGSIESKDKPTSTMFEVRCSASDSVITIKHMGGDVIYKENVRILISHGYPKMSTYLPNDDNFTFYPESKKIRDAAMDQISLQTGQVATYKFVNDYTHGNSTGQPGCLFGDQVIMVGESFEFALVDINTENTIYETILVMEP